MECERPILMRSRDHTDEHVQYLTPIITRIPDRHQFPIIRLIKQEPIDQPTKHMPLNPMPAKKHKTKLKSKEGQRRRNLNDRILLLNPLFQLRERLNKVVSRSTSTGTQETSSSRFNISTAAETEKSSTSRSTCSDSSMFYIDVANLDRTESETSTNSISTILNIKEELDNNLNTLQSQPSRRIQPNQELTNNNAGPSATTKISVPRLDSCKQPRIIIPKVEIEISSSSDSELDSMSVSHLESGRKKAKRISTLEQLPTQTQANTLSSSFVTTIFRSNLSKPLNACNICGKTFKGHDALKVHLVTHTGDGERPFECHVCHKTFTTLSSLSNHNKIHLPQIANSSNKNSNTSTNSKELQCKNCGNSFSTKGNHQRHISNRTCWKQPFRCGVCNKIFSTRQNMYVHVRCHTGENPFACCDINFRTQAGLDRHKNQHTFNCDVCGEGFIEKILLERHIKTNNHNIAGEIHSPNNTSGKRLRVQTKSKPINSSGKRLPVRTKSKQKRKRKLYYSDKRFRCSYCSKIFHSKQGLSTHEMIHKLNEKQFSCGLCSMKFSSAANLKIHRTRIHKGAASKKSVTSTSIGTNNVTTNNQQKPHRCTYCPKSFLKSTHLLIHTRRHTGEKPYPCQHCSMKFVTRTDVVKHTRTHTGEKPYTCTYCPSKFAQKNAMLSHAKTHANGKYPCNTCKNKFSTLPSLSSHYLNSIQCKEV